MGRRIGQAGPVALPLSTSPEHGRGPAPPRFLAVCVAGAAVAGCGTVLGFVCVGRAGVPPSDGSCVGCGPRELHQAREALSFGGSSQWLPPLAVSSTVSAAFGFARGHSRECLPRQRTSGAALEPQEVAAGWFQAFWKFLRPHTIRGTMLGSSIMVIRVVLELGRMPDLMSLLPKAFIGVTSLLCGNGYIVGINQIFDVGIDTINKPFLPIAAQELSIREAWWLIVCMAVCGVGLAFGFFGPVIGSLYSFGLLLGTLYSVPPFRLKRSAIAAAMIISVVRGFLLNFGVYYATREMLSVPFSWSHPAIFITCFSTMFALVIAVTKDLPDVQGDTEHNIRTFATRFGVDKVAAGATLALLANYAQALVWASWTVTRGSFRTSALLSGHATLASLLLRGFLRLQAADFSVDAVKGFYRLIWFLFYSEYLLFPFI